ncbi:Fc.00g028400.m01.CDS01 [Cosmosporella sp. VM-42]
MKPTTICSVALVAATHFLGALAATKVVRAAKPTPSPSTLPVLGQVTSHGCFSHGGNLTVQNSVQGVSGGSCYNACKKKDFLVSGLHAGKCYCGMVYPPKSDETDDDACDFPCPGYALEPCGSLDTDAYSIFNTGLDLEVEYYEPDTSTSASPTSTKGGSKTSAVETSVVTKTDEPSPTQSADKGEKKKSGPNVAAIAAGVVVGVVVMAAAVGALFFFVRRKRNAEIEEEHRRNAAVNAFINGSKPPGSSGSISMTDSRLDPVMAHRRMSDGSIADNQDYSRRILRVTNA